MVKSYHKSDVKRVITTSRKFVYEKGGVDLSFTLFTNDVSQFRAFKSLLEEAIKDMDIEIEAMEKSYGKNDKN